MRFVVDECTGPVVAGWLRQQGHDVFSVYEQASGLGDPDILAEAVAEHRILITNDKDFGEMVFRAGETHEGIILLRLDDESPTNKIRVLQQLLDKYADRLAANFTVVTETAVRIVQPRRS